MGDFREHTGEFAALVEAISQQSAASSTAASRSAAISSSRTGALAARSQFAMVASDLGKDIHRTSEKLSRLANRLLLLPLHTPHTAHRATREA